jgi:undecaprenyl diphosphate synthase
MIPTHIAIIMDGNRRWARKRGLPVLEGHRVVVRNILRPLAVRAKERGVKFLTCWAFSTENWARNKREVSGLFSIFRQALKEKLNEVNQEGIRIKVIGDISKFPADLQEGIEKVIKATAGNNKLTVIFALNYGGRDEIIRAISKLSPDVLENLTEEKFSQYLDTAGIPDPELMIRTGGELRLSGFLSWQSSYSELYFTEVLMPDFTPDELDEAINEFMERKRRFGK